MSAVDLSNRRDTPEAIAVPVPSPGDLGTIRRALEVASVVLSLTPSELTMHAVPSVSRDAQHNALTMMGEAITFFHASSAILEAAQDRLATALPKQGTHK